MTAVFWINDTFIFMPDYILFARLSEIRRINSFSSITSIPSSFALASFPPASLPATTTSVFFETEDVTYPPFDSMRCFASERVRFSSVPVRTNVIPEKISLRIFSFLFSRLTPVFFSFSTIALT